MSETVQLFQRASGTWMVACPVDLNVRRVYQPMARPAADGVHLWCRHCKAEHDWPWPALLLAMEKFMPPPEFVRSLRLALGPRAAVDGLDGEE